MTLRLVVNGEERELDRQKSLTQFLGDLGFDGRYVAVARNGDVLDRSAFDSIMLQDGDRLEIVRPVGGG